MKEYKPVAIWNGKSRKTPNPLALGDLVRWVATEHTGRAGLARSMKISDCYGIVKEILDCEWVRVEWVIGAGLTCMNEIYDLELVS